MQGCITVMPLSCAVQSQCCGGCAEGCSNGDNNGRRLLSAH